MGRLAYIFDISLEVANGFYTWGWRLSVSGAVVTMFGVGLLWWGTRVRDHDFETRVATLHDRAVSSEERSKLLEQGNLTLQRNVEQERIERLKLEERLKWRIIPDDRAENIRRRLLQAPKGKAAIVSNVFDTEARAFAKRIEDILKSANVEIVPYPGTEPIVSWGVPGTNLYVLDVNKAGPFVTALQAAFEAEGFLFEGIGGSKHVVKPDDLVIGVGQKP